MTKINWFKREEPYKQFGWNSNKFRMEYKPRHSEWNPIERSISIRSDDPDMDAHVAIAHELGHYRLDVDSSLQGEIEAWNEAVYSLMKVGEWTPEAKHQAIWALASYFEEDGSYEPNKEAAQWIHSAENRAKRLLRGR